MKVILCGMNNPLHSDPRYALFPYPPGCAGWRILELLRIRLPDLTRSQYSRGFERINLVDDMVWDRWKARDKAAQLPSLYRGRTIVLFGDGVRRAVGLPKELIHPIERDGVVWRQLPHPSGRCRWYNDPEARDLASSLLYDMFMEGRR